jgi:hypothetical protein
MELNKVGQYSLSVNFIIYIISATVRKSPKCEEIYIFNAGAASFKRQKVTGWIFELLEMRRKQTVFHGKPDRHDRPLYLSTSRPRPFYKGQELCHMPQTIPFVIAMGTTGLERHSISPYLAH